VRDLQLKLTALGYPLQPDGAYGEATANAVRRFQKDRALQIDGVAGERTYAAIEASLAAAVSGGPLLWIWHSSRKWDRHLLNPLRSVWWTPPLSLVKSIESGNRDASENRIPSACP
jgi:hypothetical protein